MRICFALVCASVALVTAVDLGAEVWNHHLVPLNHTEKFVIHWRGPFDPNTNPPYSIDEARPCILIDNEKKYCFKSWKPSSSWTWTPDSEGLKIVTIAGMDPEYDEVEQVFGVVTIEVNTTKYTLYADDSESVSSWSRERVALWGEKFEDGRFEKLFSNLTGSELAALSLSDFEALTPSEGDRLYFAVTQLITTQALRFYQRGERVSRRSPPPGSKPEVCFGFLSWRRLTKLRQSVHSVVSHMEHTESEVPYELVWVSNGGESLSEVRALGLYYQDTMEKILHLRQNQGLQFGFNMWASLCRAPYFVPMEEDWIVRADQLLPFVTMGVDVLRTNPVVIQVVLRILGESHVYRSGLVKSDWQFAAGGTEYRTWCWPNGIQGQFGGAWSNGPSVVDREKFMSVGMFDEKYMYDNEYGLPRRASAMGYCLAELRVDERCMSTACTHAFQHIGWDKLTFLGNVNHIPRADGIPNAFVHSDDTIHIPLTT